ncbi:hypothetical protein AHAS_Ahas16G0248000 [Arachis hypogaea]
MVASDGLRVESATVRSKRRFKKLEYPKCNCGMYAIVFQFQTVKNLNRLFFGCPYFKVYIGFVQCEDINLEGVC